MCKCSTNKAKRAGITNRVFDLLMISPTTKSMTSPIKSGPKGDSLICLMNHTKRLLSCHNIVSKRVFDNYFPIRQAFFQSLLLGMLQ